MSENGIPLASIPMETTSPDGGVVGGVDDPDPYLATTGPLLMQRIVSRGETYALTLTKKIGIVSILALIYSKGFVSGWNHLFIMTNFTIFVTKSNAPFLAVKVTLCCREFWIRRLE